LTQKSVRAGAVLTDAVYDPVSGKETEGVKPSCSLAGLGEATALTQEPVCAGSVLTEAIDDPIPLKELERTETGCSLT